MYPLNNIRGTQRKQSKTKYSTYMLEFQSETVTSRFNVPHIIALNDSWYVGMVCSTKKACDNSTTTWWRHQMRTFSALLAICAGNSPVSGEFPTQRPVTRSIDIFFDLRLNKRLSKQSWGWWFETLSGPLWRHGNEGNLCDVNCE